MKLRDLPAQCFQGVAPSIIATCDADGIPNVTYLSQVYRIDDDHVALSCQFFNKTKKNVLANPYATTQVNDPATFDTYRIEMKYERAETDGPVFEDMRRRIDVIASYTGMTGVFRLLSADIYRVVAIEKVEGFLRPCEGEAATADIERAEQTNEMISLRSVSQAISRARNLDELFSCTVDALCENLGFENSMILLPDETGARLYAIAGRGYGESGVGAEVGFGEGLIGTVARERCILRVAGVGAELRYGRAIRTSAQRAGGIRLRPEIPLPGLIDAQSQMALPLVTKGRLVGVIAVESKKRAAFEEWHEPFLEIVANQIATAIEGMSLRDKGEDKADAAFEIPVEKAEAPAPPAPASQAGAPTLKLRFFKSDDCVFVGDEYLVRNVPGRILWKVLRELTARGRTDFTNRELRLDGSLGLPPIRDNLESRLVLLRKRLEQKCPQIKLVPTARGRFRVELSAPVELEESP